MHVTCYIINFEVQTAVVVVVPAFQYIALVLKEMEPRHCRWGTKEVDAP